MYPLNELLFLSISSLLSGINDWPSTVIFGEEKIEWLRQFFPYKHGIPSQDTLERVFSSLDAIHFETCFRDWVNQISSLTKGEIVAIDGKTICGSYDISKARKAIHVVSAYATQSHLCLGQTVTDQKSNEITAIPELLDLLAIKGCTVSMDAMGCQQEIASKIREKEADYLLAVKKNQKDLYEQIEKLFDRGGISTTFTSDSVGNGRVDTRKCSVINDLTFLDGAEKWRDCQSIIALEKQSYNKTTAKSTLETRYYISSKKADAQTFNDNIRSHWAIENNLHWMLDVSFNEDLSRRRKNNHAIICNIMAKTALTLLKQFPLKCPLSHKKRKAILNDDFRQKILGC